MTKVTQQVTDEYKRVMVYASYLLGHLDGVERAVDAAAPKAMNVLASHQYFEPFFLRLHNELRALFSTYGDWKGRDVFNPLQELAHELLKVGGIDIQARPEGGAHIDIPHHPDTMPTSAELAAFSTARTAGNQE